MDEQREVWEEIMEELIEEEQCRKEKWAAWWQNTVVGCDKALCLTSAVTAGILIGIEEASIYFPSPAGYGIFCVAGSAFVWIAFWLLQKLLHRVLGHGLGWLMALGSSAAALCFAVKKGAGEGWTWRVFAFAGGTAIILWLLTLAWWNMIRRVRATTVLASLLATIAAVGIVAFLVTDGRPDQTLTQYLALTQTEEKMPLSAEAGAWAVSVWDYEGDSVDLSHYAVRGTGVMGFYLERTLDYDLDETPLRGRVWYPEGGENCPVLFIAHGNHEISTPSYLGYAYLGEYLASHGYVVVSVDQTYCNMLSNENDARAVLLLEHLKFILECNGREADVLYRKIDPENVALAGHSRGGEMVATAYLFNGYGHYPENGTIRFDYGFSIKSLIAIAPTVDQYQPAGHSVAIENVNYLLLHGASDRDVTNFEGMSQYENVTFTDGGEYIKSALYIANANHGQFNSLWGQYDCGGMGAPFLNTAHLLSEADQQEITCLLVKAFLDVTLKGEESERTLLTDCEDYALPETVYVQCHQESGFVPIADFEEDSNLETATMAGARLSVSGVSSWREGTMDSGHAMRLRWGAAATVTLETPTLDLTDAALTFDICDLDSRAVREGDIVLLDATVYLEDEDGNRAAAQVSDYAVIYPVLCVKTDKLDDLFDTPSTREAFATVSIPAAEFDAAENSINLAEITTIELRFFDGGQVALDNIGITPV